MCEEINNYTACALGSENTSNGGLVFVAREFFASGFWRVDPKPPNRMSDKAMSKIEANLYNRITINPPLQVVESAHFLSGVTSCM